MSADLAQARIKVFPLTWQPLTMAAVSSQTDSVSSRTPESMLMGSAGRLYEHTGRRARWSEWPWAC
jgi:hypothetical protein